MKRFSVFLLEASMSRDEAMRILGLSGSYTADVLKQKYRAASMANHPDRGGSTEKMQQVNAAYAVLTGTTSSSNGTRTTDTTRNTYDREWWIQREEKRQAFMKVAQDTFDAAFRPIVFQKHFENVMKEGFTLTKEAWSAQSSTGDWCNKVFEWSNVERTIVFYLSCTVYFEEMFKAKTIAAPDSFLNTILSTEILMNRKKVKLYQERYSWAKTREAIVNPEMIFPAAKLKVKASATASAPKPLKRADVELTFRRELNAKQSDDWMYVPMNDGELVAVFNRRVLFRVGMWMFEGLHMASKYGGAGKSVGGSIKYTSIYEEWAHMTPLFNTLKELQRGKHEPTEIVQAINATIEHIKTIPSTLGQKPIR